MHEFKTFSQESVHVNKLVSVKMVWAVEMCLVKRKFIGRYCKNHFKVKIQIYVFTIMTPRVEALFPLSFCCKITLLVTVQFAWVYIFIC